MAGLFVCMWKWKHIEKFFGDHNRELERLEEMKRGSKWITDVMKANKILPIEAIVPADES